MFKTLLNDEYSFPCHHTVEVMIERIQYSLGNKKTSTRAPNLGGYFISNSEFVVSVGETGFRRTEAIRAYGRVVENEEGVFLEIAFRPERLYVMLSWILCFFVLGAFIAVSTNHWAILGLTGGAIIPIFYNNMERAELIESVKKIAAYK